MAWYKVPHEDGDGHIVIDGKEVLIHGGVFEAKHFDHPQFPEVPRPIDWPREGETEEVRDVESVRDSDGVPGTSDGPEHRQPRRRGNKRSGNK